jgi:hypothetical protein
MFRTAVYVSKSYKLLLVSGLMFDSALLFRRSDCHTQATVPTVYLLGVLFSGT